MRVASCSLFENLKFYEFYNNNHHNHVRLLDLYIVSKGSSRVYTLLVGLASRHIQAACVCVHMCVCV